MRKADAERKSQKPASAVALSSGVGAPASLNLGAEGWKRIQCAYGKNLLQEADRIVIDRIVNSYLRWQPFERAAPFRSDVERTLSGIEQRLRAELILLDTSSTGSVVEWHISRSWAQLSGFGAGLSRDAPTRFASGRVRDANQQKDEDVFSRSYWADKPLPVCIVVCAHGPNFVEGDAWKTMIAN